MWTTYSITFLLIFPLSVLSLVDIKIFKSYQPIGTIFQLDSSQSVKYLADAQSVFSAGLSAAVRLEKGALATSFWINDNRITKESIETQLGFYRRFDDVWNDEFLDCVLLSYKGSGAATIGPKVYDFLKQQGARHIFISENIRRATTEPVATSVMTERPPPGPFVVLPTSDTTSSVIFRNVYRLYVDESDAFLSGAIPNPVDGGWFETNFTHIFEDGTSSQLIPVPSRIPTFSSTLPFAGMRFGLKDIYNAKGMPTGAGSHAYRLTNQIPNETAPSVQKLVDLGAIMVGKTRTSQFAHGAQPWEFIDIPYSWNPRGDGHLTAAASSSGSACAIAAYPWLEFAVGSDTRGSVRKPATLVGVYGIRPSHGSMDLTGVLPLSEEMDTAGFFARHPGLFYEVATRWFSESPVANRKPVTRFPSKLLYPTEHFPVKNEQAQKVIEGFIDNLRNHLNIQPIHINFTELISPFFPNGTFPEFQRSSNKLGEYRSWMDVGKPTTEKYASQFGGQPVFDPVTQMMFSRARNISAAEFSASVEIKRRFAEDVATHIFKGDEESCSDAIFIYETAAGGQPSYRVEDFNHLSGASPFTIAVTTDGQEAKFKDFFNFVASMGELPEITIPIGEARYFSHLSGIWEPIPVAIELVARKGCDVMLLELVKKLGDLGIVQQVSVGRYMFPRG